MIISGACLSSFLTETILSWFVHMQRFDLKEISLFGQRVSPSVSADGWGQFHTIIYLEIELDERERVGIGIDMCLSCFSCDGHVIKELLGYR
jgi:hypothetical protein